MRNSSAVQCSGPVAVETSVFRTSGAVMGRETVEMAVMKLDVRKLLKLNLPWKRHYS